jgi:EAL domain-containing protein (putative c-di-GMP-specific phosphodiesterase class I)
VEEPEQLECLRRLGCHFAQGFYFAQPMPAEELTLMLQQGLARGAQLPANVTNGSY